MKLIKFFSISVALFCLASCSEPEEKNFMDSKLSGSMELEYAKQFSVDYYDDISLITIGDGKQYLLIPPESEVPEDVPEDITIIKQPLDNIYAAASSAVDLFSGINSLDSILAVSTDEKDWSLPDVKKALQDGDILYAGKYSAPDYELLLSENCELAVESTMIYHCPEIKEQLENQGIPVIVERSSYETHPLGRMEWIKLYGLLLGKEDEAAEFFNEKSNLLDEITSDEITGKTAVFFYITSNGYVNVRKPGDYISKMIELAGGSYILTPDELNVEENALSTMNMQFESFYALAKDADYIIYNGTIDGGITSVDELIEKNSLIADFKAVKDGNVWCTDKNMFQQTSAAADMINDFYKIFTGSSQETEFLYHLS